MMLAALDNHCINPLIHYGYGVSLILSFFLHSLAGINV